MPKLNNICVKWGNRSIFDCFSLEIKENKVTAILGKSGVGKTTLLNVIANLIPFSGEVLGFYDISYVFQEHRLLPFATVYKNLEFVLGDMPEDKKRQKIDEVLTILKISNLSERVAKTLSGGEKQRVSLARAFLVPSSTILLDEPFDSLDLGLKISIINDFKNLLKAFPKTCVFVTHSEMEAIYLADDIFVLDNNKAEFIGSPKKIEKSFGDSVDDDLRRKIFEKLL